MRTANIFRIAFHAILLTFLFVLPAFSQQRWQRTYGGTGDDESRSVQQTTDGGYIVAGYTGAPSPVPYQIYLIKTNASGDTLWTRTYGGTGDEWGYSVQQTTDGGYIVVGRTYSFGNNEEVYLVKTNSFGDTLWTKTYGGTGDEWGSSVQQTQDGGYIVAGDASSFGNIRQVYLVKTNASGDTLWTRNYGGASDDWGRSVQQTTDGGYIVAGGTTSFGNGSQVYLVKTNASGDTLWTRTYGEMSEEYGFSVRQTSDTGFIVAGVTRSFGNYIQVYLVKTNASGDTLWTRNYGGTTEDEGWSVQQTTDGGYIISGYTGSFGVDYYQVYLVKTDASGDTLWTRTYGDTLDDGGYSVQQTTDGGYIVAGYTYSIGNYNQVYLIKTDANGNVGVESNPTSRLTPYASRLAVSPNPFSSFATVPGHSHDRFSLYDISGRRVGIFRGDRIGEGLAPGVYFLRAESGKAKPLRVVKVR
jgi:hypothetical protein